VWALIASLYVGNLMLLVLNLPLVGIWVKILQIPRPYLYAGILVFAALGAFSVNFTPIDVIILLILGILGFFMRRFGYPVAPMVVGLILGPIFENQLRRSLAISQGDPVALVSSPIAAAIYVVLIIIFVLSFWMRKRQGAMEAETAEALEDGVDDGDGSTRATVAQDGPDADGTSGAAPGDPAEPAHPGAAAGVPGPDSAPAPDAVPGGAHSGASNTRNRKESP
jgi:putative tricarboxylic transport membrane protein